MIINKALYPVSSTIKTINNMQKQMENLQLQLATGKRYNSLAEIGQDRIHDLNIRARLGRIEGFQANILTVETRLSFYTNALQRLDEIESDARGLAVPGAYGTNGINLANSKSQAATLLREVIDTLNTDIMGQYIFGGNASDRKPVASFDQVMNGHGGKAGFSTVVDERLDADKLNTGRLNVPYALGDTSVTLTEDGDHIFGFKLDSITLSGSYATATPITAPHDPEAPVANSISVDFTNISELSPGQTITIGVTYPDDRSRVEYITLTASDTLPLADNAYLIGDDEAATARNFHDALTKTLGKLTETKLHAASTYAAADNFFNASDQPIMRVAGGPPPDQLVADTNADNTVRWYNGQNSDNPRQTVSTNIDEATRINYGVQANEYGIVELMKGLAVFAVGDLSLVGEDAARDAGRYDGLVGLQRGRLSEVNNAKPGSIEGITMELGIAANTLNTVKARHTQYNAQLRTMLSEIESAPIEEVAMQMLTLQTRLQASYQVTSMVSQLTLVNYLR